MRKIFYILIYLNIYTSVTHCVIGQELLLNLSSEKGFSKTLQDSINVTIRHVDFRSLENESKRIEEELWKIGYIENELQHIHKIHDSLYTASYNLGPQVKLLKVYYNSETFNSNQLGDVIEIVTDTYFIIPFDKTEKVLNALNLLQVSNGNSFAKLNLSSFKKITDTITAQLASSEGRSRVIDSIIIKGYQKFPRSFVKNYAGIKIKQTFNRDVLVKKVNVLNNLNFVNSLKPPEVLFEETKTSVFLYLEKQNSNLFDGILGFASKSDSSGLELNGYVNLELNNNLNYGEQLLVNYKADGEKQRNFSVKTTLPYILKSPIGVSLELKLFRRDSTFSTNEQLAKVIYQVNPAFDLNIGYKSYNSSNLQRTENDAIDISDFNSKFILGGFEYKNYQNNALFPKKSALVFEIELGKRETTILNNNQTRLHNIYFYIFNLNRRNSIFIKNETSVLFSDEYLTNELFRFGGINSIRGFSENSIDASLFSTINTEYRYLLSSKSYIHSIIDVGYFENELLQQKEKLYGFGIGLGLQTQAGLFKFNFANGIIENQDFKFSNSKIHFSLVTNF